MDFIAFKTQFLSPTSLESAVPVNGYTSVQWTERYRDPGEFKFTAPLSSGLRDVLPLDTLVSHTKTSDLMYVESHVINEEKDKDPIIEITGRSFDCFLEQRVVSMHRDWESYPDGIPSYILPFDYSYEQAKSLINMIIDSAIYFRPEEGLDDIVADTDISGTTTPTDPVARVINRGYLNDRVRELLAVDDLGLRVIRRNPFGVIGDPTNTILMIHNGKDRRSSVIFSSKKGDIDAASYLWTNKTLKNAALVTGRWLETRVDAGGFTAEGFARRELFIDATDIDQNFTEAPVGTDKTDVIAHLVTRGQTLLASQRQFLITQADISDKTKYEYRKDYSIGDIVTVQSNYGDVMPMRVVEFTEIQDATGQSGHPTLNVLDY